MIVESSMLWGGWGYNFISLNLIEFDRAVVIYEIIPEWFKRDICYQVSCI